MKYSYIVKVSWVAEGFELFPVKMEETVTPTSRDTLLIFEYAGEKYTYNWRSSPMQGLSWLHKDGKKVYDPYLVKDQDTTMMEAGRLLYLDIKNNP